MRQVLIQNVQAGIFQNVVRLEHNRPTYSITSEAEYWAKVFEQMCIYPQPPVTRSYPIRVFRGLHSLTPFTCPHVLPHPLPFSASLSKQFSSDWVSGLPNPIVLEFIVYPSMMHLVVDSDVEREVIVGAGELCVAQQTHTHDGITYYACHLVQART